MIPDRLRCFLNDFWNFEKNHQICTRRPPNYYQNASTNTRKCGNIFEKHYFSYLRVWKSENVGRSVYLFYRSSNLCFFEILECANCGTSSFYFWTFDFLTCWNFEKLESRGRAPGNDEDPRKQISKSLDVSFISIKKHELEV